ncbi:MAG TPA: pitrilysin family protein [Chthoniobacteraceae bacterium]|jgi:predicted Zn-dependent peptidase|nr:pitrilysin family protein [Chthoniobacteraceae bacterium]
MTAYRLTRLPNGVRIASYEMPHMRSVTTGIWVGVGGRHEKLAECGMSHFIEHLLFKGTARRSARKITEAVEGLGGYLNAYTTEDHTCYYSRAAARHLPQLADVLCDMFVNSEFAVDEIERERDVIREEILSYRDQPEQHASDLLTETMWPRHPLGRPLTGTLESIGRFRRPELKRFVHEHYNGTNTIVAVAGPVSHEEVVRLFAPTLGKLPAGKKPPFTHIRAKTRNNVSVKAFPQETEQMHLAMGFHAFGRRDDRRYALRMLSVLLGENMSSRLFQTLRERHGYCYSVQTSIVTLDDTGAIQICAGLDPTKLRKALGMILKELERICSAKPSARELKKARDYTIGQTAMGLESTTNQMMWMGESLLGYGKILDPGELEKKVMGVEPEDVQKVACHCLSRGRLGVAVVGPVKQDEVTAWLHA